ncbi:MAG: NAD-dependent epimerase/dehydratase family protein [Tepidisphaeraceae bacterium]
MRVLLIGGTGLISVGIVKHLLAMPNVEIVMFNRGKRGKPQSDRIRTLVGDRNEFEVFEKRFAAERFDVVIDMICFTPAQAMSSVRAFGGRTTQFIFCSTVCSYGVKVPSYAVVDEQFPQEPISQYGRDKLACERIFLDAHPTGAFATTIIRPSHTYGEGSPMIDQLEPDAVAFDRIARGLPVLCAGDGLGLWNSTHRDDCGKLFAHAGLRPVTYGKSYNATTQRVFTWRDFYREAAAALGTQAKLLFMPAEWIVKHDPRRFQLLNEITRYHGAYTSELAMQDVPQFTCDIDFPEGVKRTLDDVKQRGAWKDSSTDALYQKMVDEALASGVEPVVA